MMPGVIHFEINADEPARAVEFYREVFGWVIESWEGPMEYWLITTYAEGESGINGAITRRMEGNTTVNTIGVPDLEAFISKVEASGGSLVTPKMTVPGVGYMAYCRDTEGNTFGIMQEDPSAA
jgi:predicted enzyme related to lactoylglutathione lyase